MRLVQVRDGVLEIRWTWLPFWLAVNPVMKQDLEKEIRDSVILGGVGPTAPDMDALHDFVVARLQKLFPSHPGLAEYLDGVKYIEEPS
jgi:hypothetical protein